MSFRPVPSQNLQNYPKIQIERNSVIRPCNTDQNAADQFIDHHQQSWRRFFHDAWQEGIPYVSRWVTDSQPPASRPFYLYLWRALRYFILLLLQIHHIYIMIYGYFFPYSLLPLDEICDEFSRSPKWSEAIMRAFAWHPNHDRCALAICNDYIHVYQGSNRFRVLRHAQQRKITDLAWQPSTSDILVVATQQNIIIWRVGQTHNQPASILKEPGVARGPAYLSLNLQLIFRGKDVGPSPSKSMNGSLKQTDTVSRCDTNNIVQADQTNDFKIISHVLPPPIISIQFDQTGSKLYACSPNSCKIAILRMDIVMDNWGMNDLTELKRKTDQKPIEYLMRIGQGFARLLWSPEKNRLATVTTSNVVRVFEPYTWTHNRWSLHTKPIQDMVWSHPQGRVLLLANKEEPIIYALPFLDDPQAGDVGGNKSIMRALDLTATRTESGDLVGGLVQALAWDKNGKRLAISFKENSESILLYRTVERPTVEFHQLGVIQSETGGFPLFMSFHDKFQKGSLLTICWSDGCCQHIPMYYSANEQTRLNSSCDTNLNRSLNNGSMLSNSMNSSCLDPKSPPKTPRSLTNFCHVAGNNSISPFPTSLLPINKVQHQTTLFSVASRPPLDVSRDSLNSDD